MTSHELAHKLLDQEDLEVGIPVAYKFTYGYNYEPITNIVIIRDAMLENSKEHLFLEGDSKINVPVIDPKFLL